MESKVEKESTKTAEIKMRISGKLLAWSRSGGNRE